MWTSIKGAAKAVVSAIIAALSVLAGATQHGQHLTQNAGILAALAFFVSFNAVYFTTNAGTSTVTMDDLQKQINAIAAIVNKLGSTNVTA